LYYINFVLEFLQLLIPLYHLFYLLLLFAHETHIATLLIDSYNL